jgi:hypothetical protein
MYGETDYTPVPKTPPVYNQRFTPRSVTHQAIKLFFLLLWPWSAGPAAAGSAAAPAAVITKATRSTPAPAKALRHSTAQQSPTQGVLCTGKTTGLSDKHMWLVLF